MKKMVLFLMIASSVMLFSQYDDDYEYDGILRKISIGAGLNLKAGYNISDLPYNLGSSLGFGFDLDGLFYMPVSEDKETGLLVNLSYYSYPFGLVLKSAGADVTQTHNYTYLAVGADIVYNGLMAGLNIGLFPLSGSRSENGNSQELATDLMGTTFDARIGYMYNLFEDASGSLNLTGKISYTFSPIIKEDMDGIRNEVTNESMRYNFTPLIISVGVNYLFKME